MNNIHIKSLFITVLILCVVQLSAQTIIGTVFSQESNGKQTVPGATVYFSESRTGTTTDIHGKFSLKKEGNRKEYLIVRFVGYEPDSILVEGKRNVSLEFVLTESHHQLDEVVVSANRSGTVFSAMTPLKTELITQSGLMKMACCNLSESFENSATVTVGFTDAVSGAKQVQLLGLSGIYSQMQAENIPTLRGLASTYGWSYTPGLWLESIQISKGASSVVNGYESITGQINLEYRKPNTTEPLFVNLYYDDASRYEGNLSAAVKVSDKLWTGLMLHGSSESKEHDRNGDTFLDMPKTKLVNAYNRWFYLDQEKGIQSRTGIRFLHETRQGGQHFHEGSAPLFETFITNRNFTVDNKTGIAVGDKEGQSIGIINSFTMHEQDSEFGMKSFEGKQVSTYSNLMFASFIGTTAHRYTTGVSFTYDNYDTFYLDSLSFNNTPRTSLGRTEIVPGAYAEYTYSYADHLTFILGMRMDYNSKYGWLATPRTNIRYNIGDFVILRASAGRGYRSPNVISDNIGLMASSRKFYVEDISSLDIESAWNLGGNITVYVPVWSGRRMTLSLDYFHTVFDNQAIVDIERDRHAVYFYNLEGRSYANAVQADLSMTLFKGFDLFAAFRYNNNKITYSDGTHHYEVDKPLVSSYRGLINLSYATNFKRWAFDVTAQLNGPSRIPGLNGYGSENERSEMFPVYFAQISKNSKRFDIYLGVENLLDYTQKDPIYGWDDPFGRQFDSSLIWGPLMGRKIYCGIRLRIGKLY